MTSTRQNEQLKHPKRRSPRSARRAMTAVVGGVVAAVAASVLQVAGAGPAAAGLQATTQQLSNPGDVTQATLRNAQILIATAITRETFHTIVSSAAGTRGTYGDVRLDHQGLTSEGDYNFQIQINGQQGASTIGAVIFPKELTTLDYKWAAQDRAQEINTPGTVPYAELTEAVNLLRAALFRSVATLLADGAAQAFMIVTNRLSNAPGARGRQLNSAGSSTSVVDYGAQWFAAGPLYDQADADRLCPGIAESLGREWSGQWKTFERNISSGCAVRPATFSFHGPLDQTSAKQVCGNDATALGESWNGQWTNLSSTTSVCAFRPAA
jgi:hypothetical protein